MRKWLIVKTFRLYLKFDRRFGPKVTLMEFILLSGVAFAITIKFKAQIEEKLSPQKSPIQFRYYDYVEPQIKPRIPDYLRE